MEKLVLESAKVMDLLDGNPDVTDYKFIDSEFAGDWRWGVSYQIVVEDSATGKLWGTVYNVQIGDNYYNSIEDGPVHFYPVEAVVVSTTEYKRMKDV